MRTVTVALVLALFLLACSSDSTAGPCAQRKGTYSARYAVRSGDCGEVSEQISTTDKQPTAVSAPCKGTIAYSSDNCEVTVSSTCPGLTATERVVREAKARWNQDASQGSAVEQVTIVDGNRVICSGTYDIAITRL